MALSIGNDPHMREQNGLNIIQSILVYGDDTYKILRFLLHKDNMSVKSEILLLHTYLLVRFPTWLLQCHWCEW